MNALNLNSLNKIFKAKDKAAYFRTNMKSLRFLGQILIIEMMKKNNKSIMILKQFQILWKNGFKG